MLRFWTSVLFLVLLCVSQVAGQAASDEAESEVSESEETAAEGNEAENAPADEAPQETAVAPVKSPEEVAAEKAEQAWLADSATIYQLIAPLRQYRESSDDSSVQKQARRRKLATTLRQVNEKAIGKSLALQVVVVDDVTAEKEITKHGLKRVRQLRKEIEKDPSAKLLLDASGDDWAENPLLRMTIGFYLAGCEKCFRETGRYTATFKIPGLSEYGQSGIKNLGKTDRPEGEQDAGSEESLISVEIMRTIRSEDEALKYTKDKKMPLKGKIVGIDYDGSRFSESVKIYIE